MRLFLASQDFGGQVEKLLSLVGAGRNAAVIANASDYKKTKAERDKRVKAEFDQLSKLGFKCKELDLRTATDPGIVECLQWADLVWIRGGHVRVLMDAMVSSGFNKLIIEFLKKDKLVFAGYSAGAAVAGPTLEPFKVSDYDDGFYSNKEPLTDKGLGLIDYVIIPHWNQQDRSNIRKRRHNDFHKKNIKHKCLKDDEVIVVR